MNFAELFNSLLENSKDRIKTPITGAYLIAFLVWNWRPILLLLFENATMTNKILVINDQYCNIWAILGPFAVALVFTVGVPYIMVIIEKLLRRPKLDRQMNSYDEKAGDLDMKIKLASKELILQDVVSRNKEKEDFVEKIKQLETQLENEKTSHKRQSDDYQKQLDDLNTVLTRQSTNSTIRSMSDLSQSEKDIYKVLLDSDLNNTDLNFLRSLPNSTANPLNTLEYPVKVVRFLEDKNFISVRNGELYLNSNGLKLKAFLTS